MMRSSHWLLVAAVTLLSGSIARAQDAGQAGIVVAYPASVGMIWHISDRFAIRPDFSFADQGNAAINLLTAAVGVSGIVYVRKWDALRAYVTPRFAYSRESATNTPGSTGSPPTDTYGGMGSFGFQYALQRRFGMFGETGVAYSHSSTNFGDVTGTIHTWSTRAGMGLIFYF